jgi:ketol-acid reductoisomerase
MDARRDADIDPTPLRSKRVAIIGYGNQGRAQALNLEDSGVNVIVGLRDGSASAAKAEADGVATGSLAEAARTADIVMLLAPDETLAAIYRTIEPYIQEGAALGFSHGLAIRFGFIVPRPDLDIFMVAPKGPGTALRSLYQAGQGMIALYAVAQDASGQAEALALAYGRALGCGRAGLLGSTFAEECEADLFNEQAVVWGAVPEILIAGFDTLVEAGVSEEVAYLDCVGAVKLIAELFEARGIARMREAISYTAVLGAVLRGPRIVDDSVRSRMRAVLEEIRAGQFSNTLSDEEASAYPRLRAARERARGLRIEDARRKLLD